MGLDKALIEIDGRPLALRVADALTQAGACTVAGVGGDDAALGARGLEVRPDPWPGEGPLGGVIGALRTVGTEPTVVVLACDLLAPDPDLIARLAIERARSEVDLVVPVVGGRPQWAHGAWRRGTVDVLAGSFASGDRSLARAATALRVGWVEAHDPGAVADADVPSDLPPGT